MPPRRKSGTSLTSATHKRDPERTRRNILAVARREFAEHGLSGGRIDAIAARMSATRRMIYYYFGSKARLYQAVIEQAYGDIRNIEMDLDLDRLGPTDAIRRMVSFTFDYEEAHPQFVRLVSIENIHNGEFLAKSQRVRTQNAGVIETLAGILARGRQSGDFRTDITATDLHLLISAFCFFRIANRRTFGTLFRCDLTAPLVRAKHKRLIIGAILRLLEPRGGRHTSGMRQSGRSRPTAATAR